MSSSSTRVQVELETPQGPFELRLLDHRHRLVTRGFGVIERKLRPGLYRLEIDAGPLVEERFLTIGPSGLVDRGLQVEMPSVAPVAGTSTSHEFHAGPAREHSLKPRHAFGSGGRLVIFVRSMGEDPRAPVDVGGLQLTDALGNVKAGAADFDQHPGEGWAALSADLAPGGMGLRQRRARRRSSGGADEETIDQSLWVEEGWTTLVFVPYRPRVGRPEPEFASMHMADCETGFDPYDGQLQGANLALEIALSGLRKGRAVVPRNLEDLMLRGKFGNPMLGLVGALVLLHSERTNWRLFNEVRINLKKLVPQHPDLHALHVMGKQRRRDDSESRIPARGWPPMLLACYRGLIGRDAEEEQRIIPAGSLADLASSRVLPQGPWSQWRALDVAVSPERRDHLARQLDEILDQVRSVTTTKASGKLQEQLSHSWQQAVHQLDSRPARRRRRLAAAVRSPTLRREDPSIEDVPPSEVVKVASYISSLTAQAAELDLPISEATFDVRQLSDRVGLPRAAVSRALKLLVAKGFGF